MQLNFKIDDIDYKLDLPEKYNDPSRLTWKDGHCGIYATNAKGKQRFFRATRLKAGRQ